MFLFITIFLNLSISLSISQQKNNFSFNQNCLSVSWYFMTFWKVRVREIKHETWIITLREFLHLFSWVSSSNRRKQTTRSCNCAVKSRPLTVTYLTSILTAEINRQSFRKFLVVIFSPTDEPYFSGHSSTVGPYPYGLLMLLGNSYPEAITSITPFMF